jgi:iron complex outermembrane recepter protein
MSKASFLNLLAALAGTSLIAQQVQPSQSVTPSAASKPAAQMPEVVVTDQTPYNPRDATTATRLNVPIRDVPASIQVVPREILVDRGVTRVDQMVENVSGVHAESSYGGNGATFFNIRGFTTSNSLRDGFRNYGYDAVRDVQAIERVEVLKGPSGALYGGVGSLGGYVNTVSKRPQDRAFGEIGIMAGSYGQLRPAVDWNQPLGGGVSMRLNSAYEHNDGFRDQSGYNSFSVAPAIRWDINPDTSLVVLMEYDRLERDGFDFGVPNLPGYNSLSRTAYYGLPGDYGTNNTYAVTAIMEHKFNDNWTLRIGGNYTYAKQLSNQTFPNNYLYTGGDLLPFTTYLGADEESTDGSVQVDLLGKFETGPVKHSALFGAEYGYLSVGYQPSNQSNFNMSLSHPGRISDYVFSGQGTGGRSLANSVGIYVSDLIEITPRWKLLLGAREDWFFNETRTASGETVGKSNENHFSSRAGIVWQPVTSTSLYASCSTSYAPVIGHSISNAVFSAEKGEQFEVGVKQDLIKQRLSATLAAYHLTRDGILTSDPTNPENQIQTGEQRSRGIEFDLAGQIAPGWKVIASYAYTDAEVTSDNTLPVGDRLSNVPEHSGSLWSTYQFQDGRLKGFGFGAGLYYVGEREANLPNTYPLPAYWRADAMLFYERANWRLQVNFRNVFDVDYYTGGEAGVFNYTLNPSQPFSVQASISCKF